MEIKIALTRLLKKYSIQECDQTMVPLPVQNAGIRAPEEGVFVTVKSRDI